MFTDSLWISDFIQREMRGGPDYRDLKPPHQIYRWQNE